MEDIPSYFTDNEEDVSNRLIKKDENFLDIENLLQSYKKNFSDFITEYNLPIEHIETYIKLWLYYNKESSEEKFLEYPKLKEIIKSFKLSFDPNVFKQKQKNDFIDNLKKLKKDFKIKVEKNDLIHTTIKDTKEQKYLDFKKQKYIVYFMTCINNLSLGYIFNMIECNENIPFASYDSICKMYNNFTSVKHVENYKDRIILKIKINDIFIDSFLILDKNLSLNDAVDRCLKTIEADIKSGFDLIHIDVSKVSQDMQEPVAIRLFDYALSLNPDIMFEFGSEDNTNTGLDESINNLESQLRFVQKYKNNLKFFVTQTGSLTKHTQVGSFDVERNLPIAARIHKAGFLFKEHNADYLNANDVKLRRTAGVNAINIAPQLGTMQSKILYRCAENDQYFETFFDIVLHNNQWKKWVVNDLVDDLTKFYVSAHYFFNDPAGINLLSTIGSTVNFTKLLKQHLFSVLDEYRAGLLYD